MSPRIGLVESVSGIQTPSPGHWRMWLYVCFILLRVKGLRGVQGPGLGCLHAWQEPGKGHWHNDCLFSQLSKEVDLDYLLCENPYREKRKSLCLIRSVCLLVAPKGKKVGEGFREIMQGLRHLPCMWWTVIQSLSPHMVSWHY